MKHTSYLLLLTFYLSSSCTEDYRLRTMEQARILSVEGCITDEEGPYMVRLTENLSNLSGDTLSVSDLSIIEARVVITDDAGNRDELKPLWKEKVEKKEIFSHMNHGDSTFYTWCYLLMPLYDGVSYDTISLSSSPYYQNPSDHYKGIYYTTSITGTPGRTYTLTVDHNGKAYTATDCMPYGTKLDSVVMRPVGNAGEGKDGDGFHVPYLYFPEPKNQENYYLFTDRVIESPPCSDFLIPPMAFWEQYLSPNNGMKWHFELVSDRLMPTYVANYKLGDGPTSHTFYAVTDVDWQRYTKGYIDIYMLSVSKPVYHYYQAISEQFYQDGGAFSPAPCSPPTNVSNGGQGIFMATSVAVCRSNYFVNIDSYQPSDPKDK